LRNLHKFNFRLAKSVEEVADQLLYSQNNVLLETKSIAVRAHRVEPHGFIGITCTLTPVGGDSVAERASANNMKQDRFLCSDLKADNGDEDARKSALKSSAEHVCV
jgi:hypothetical protein